MNVQKWSTGTDKPVAASQAATAITKVDENKESKNSRRTVSRREQQAMIRSRTTDDMNSEYIPSGPKKQYPCFNFAVTSMNVPDTPIFTLFSLLEQEIYGA